MMFSNPARLAIVAIWLGGLACRRHDLDTVLPAPRSTAAASLLSMTLESPGAGELPWVESAGRRYYAGREGQTYVVRLHNNSPGELEAVVSVDGRDVISGDLADYRTQRGYVLGPFQSMSIEGFRQSLDRVAEFRFGALERGYSARRGTPEHSGVIGVAVFEGRAPRLRSGPLAQGDGNRAEPFPGSSHRGAPQGSRHKGGWPPSATRPTGASADRSSTSEPALDDAPTSESVGQPGQRPTASAAYGRGGDRAKAPATRRDRGAVPSEFAPPPAPRQQLATEYGASRLSAVHEVTFRRKHRRRPDVVFAVYYDSEEALADRGMER